MQFFFEPRGIAVVGASSKPGKGGYDLIYNLRQGFEGNIYPVNPTYEEIQGLTCYPSLAEVPDPVDLAIIMVPNNWVEDVVKQCVDRGIPGAMIQAGGFAEAGEEGRQTQEALAKLAAESGIRLWGPNCMGLVDTKAKHVFSFVANSIWERGLPSSDVSLIVQSGMLSGVFLIDIMSHGELGVSKVCSLGNKVDVDECDVLEYLLADPETKAVGMYLESIKQGRRFVELCRGANKPLVLLKGGQSARGAAAAQSHTASLAGDGALTGSLLKQAGVLPAHDFKQMLDICHSLAIYPGPQAHHPGRVGIVTYTGAAGIVSADFMENSDLEIAEITPDTKKALREVYPPWMPPANPCDIYPAVMMHGGPKTYNVTVDALCADPGVDAVLLHTFSGGFDLKPDLEHLAQSAQKANKPLFAWMQGTRAAIDEFRAEAQALGFPVFRELYRSVECLNAVFARRPALEVRADEPQPAEGVAGLLAGQAGALDEHVSKQVLALCGLPVVEEQIVSSADEAVAAAQRLGWPMVIKGLDPGLVHKTEAGLVRLDIASPEQAAQVFDELKAVMGPQGQVLVQRQAAAGLELIVGAVKDPQFGACVMCGLGGVLAEALGKAQFAMAPLSRTEALDLISRAPGQKLLDGFRGAPPVDREALAQILVALGDLAYTQPAIQEIDVNPLLVNEDGLVAVDASIILG